MRNAMTSHSLSSVCFQFSGPGLMVVLQLKRVEQFSGLVIYY